MGDWYDFDIRIIDGKEVSGFSYANKDTQWQEVFIEMTEQERQLANSYLDKMYKLNEERESMIKSWIEDSKQRALATALELKHKD